MHVRFDIHSKTWFGFYYDHSVTNSAEFEKPNKSVKNPQVKYKLYTT